MLKNDNDYRFVVPGGQHRVASLSVIGYEHIPVIFQHFLFNPTPCIVDLKNLLYGLYTKWGFMMRTPR